MANATKNGSAYNREASRPLRSVSSHGVSALRTKDLGAVRLGAQSPAFRVAVTADGGKVRLGAQGPVFRLAGVADLGKVRLGAQGPAFRV